MGTITIAPEFFAKELDLYDTKFAIVRELLQNAVDAGASRIAITEVDGELTIADNGTGMSLRIAQEVYLALGKSNAEKPGTSVGGFGRARIITCFAQRSYKIWSENYCISGVGADYEIDFVDEPIVGCIVSIVLQDRFVGCTAAAVDRIARLSCLRGVEVTFNGNEVVFKGKPVVEDNDVNIQCDVVDLYDEGDKNIIVRVNGLVQFVAWCEPAATIGRNCLNGVRTVVDLRPSISRTYLTPSRENFRNDLYSGIMEDVADSIKLLSLKFNKTEAELLDEVEQAHVEASVPEANRKIAESLLPIWKGLVEEARKYTRFLDDESRLPVYPTIFMSKEAETIAASLTTTKAQYVRFNLRCASDMSVAVAIHELCHYKHEYHDAEFARRMTYAIVEILK